MDSRRQAQPVSASAKDTVLSGTARLEAYTLLVAATFFWGGNAIAAKLAVGEVSPMLLVVLRWALTVGFLLTFGWTGLRRDWPVLRGRLVYAFLLGAIGLSLFNVLFYAAAHFTTAVNIGIIQGSIPALVLVGAFIVYRTPIGPRRACGAFMTAVGIAFVVLAGEVGNLLAVDFNRGDLLMPAGCLCYAGYTVALRNRPPVAPASLLTVMATAALIASFPLVVIETVHGSLQAPTAKGWAVIAFVALFTSVMAQQFWIRGSALSGLDAPAFLSISSRYSRSFWRRVSSTRHSWLTTFSEWHSSSSELASQNSNVPPIELRGPDAGHYYGSPLGLFPTSGLGRHGVMNRHSARQ